MKSTSLNIEGQMMKHRPNVMSHRKVSIFRLQATLAVPRRRNRVSIVAFAAPTSIPSPLTEEGAPDVGDNQTASLKPLPRKVEGPADDPRLHNPLQRMERLGTGWMGVVMELDGVCVDYEYGDVSARAWQQLSSEEGKSLPPMWALKKAEGMKNEQVIQEVFCWTRNPVEARRLAGRKEELLVELLGDHKPMIASGVAPFLDTLERSGAPVALVSSAPEKRVSSVLESSGLAPRFEVVVSGDDVYRGKPDPEGYLYAAQRMGRPPLRCVVVGNSNLSIEAAHEVGMQCVAVAGRHPVYELTAADLVVRSLSELSFVNLKQLFSLEEKVMPLSSHDEDDYDAELEVEEDSYPKVQVQVMDRY